MRFTFVVEKSLGKLARWLRILGFDAAYEPSPEEDRLLAHVTQGRILVTRTRRLHATAPAARTIFITSNRALDQVREVIHAMGIRPVDIRPFSRCSRCNTPLREITREAAREKVPEYTWETQTTFRACRRCSRVYWPGSHTERGAEIIRSLFRRGKDGLPGC